jgi:hypothetical protein
MARPASAAQPERTSKPAVSEHARPASPASGAPLEARADPPPAQPTASVPPPSPPPLPVEKPSLLDSQPVPQPADAVAPVSGVVDSASKELSAAASGALGIQP